MGMGMGMGRARWLFDVGLDVDAICGWVGFFLDMCVEKTQASEDEDGLGWIG